MIDMLAAATIVGLLTYAKQAHSLTAGGFSTFVIALILLLEPVKRLVGIYNIFQQGIGASHKIFEYLDPLRLRLRRRARRFRYARRDFPAISAFEGRIFLLSRRAGGLPPGKGWISK